ncbi:hypothetical protein ABPG75_003034 [Micractinium tetrahymenae]
MPIGAGVERAAGWSPSLEFSAAAAASARASGGSPSSVAPAASDSNEQTDGSSWAELESRGGWESSESEDSLGELPPGTPGRWRQALAREREQGEGLASRRLILQGLGAEAAGRLRDVFLAYASYGLQSDQRLEGMDALRFRKLCKDCGLTGRSFRSAAAEAAFAEVQSTELQRLDFDGFCCALSLVALSHECGLLEVAAKVAACKSCQLGRTDSKCRRPARTASKQHAKAAPAAAGLAGAGLPAMSSAQLAALCTSSGLVGSEHQLADIAAAFERVAMPALGSPASGCEPPGSLTFGRFLELLPMLAATLDRDLLEEQAYSGSVRP